jgi:hypothetical protein
MRLVAVMLLRLVREEREACTVDKMPVAFEGTALETCNGRCACRRA